MTHEEFEEVAAFDALAVGPEAWTDPARDHLRTCDRCRRVHREFHETAALVGLTSESAPPPSHLRDRVLDFARSSAHSSAHSSNQGSVPEEDRTGWERESEGRRSVPVWWLASAATFFVALWGWSEMRLQAAREQLRAAETIQRNLSEENRRLLNLEQKVAEVQPLASAQTRIFTLTGQQTAPSASARVFMHPSAGRALVFFQGLPRNASDRSYELWVIRSGQPAPQGVGTFNVDQNGTATMTLENLPPSTEIQGLAVTLEPRGGVLAPTGESYLASSS